MEPEEQVPAAQARAHVFWGCPVAEAVRAVLQRNLPAGSVLQPRHLWLLEPPADINAAVWAAVGMAALNAIHKAWSCMFRATPAAAAAATSKQQRRGGKQQQWQQSQQQEQQTQEECSAAQQLIINAGAASEAVDRFIKGVQDFVVAIRGSDEAKALGAQLGVKHPFISAEGPGDLRMCIHL